ncbi:MAG: redox-regulated ATPase YchF [Bacteriovoracaceae bacterium]|nr:redox-regulated ATPase YchF [Bacteriovoracaceae bacterium]
MALNCGIVGLPNVGKSTIFSAMTAAPAEAANYPFCTIEPNVGVVAVKDKRMDQIAELVGPQKVIPAVVEFLDIAGLVKGASKGEGLGNQFLGHIRQVNAIIHVVRCFDDGDIIHVSGRIDPIDDIEIINMELALADLESVQKRLNGIDKQIKSHNKEISSKAKIAKPILERLSETLSEGIGARTLDLDADEIEAVADLHLITLKPTLYACNVDEEAIEEDNEYVKLVRAHADKESSSLVKICGKLESEISSLESEEDKAEFMESAGLEESGLEQLIHAGYKLLGMRTYFTAGVQEVRAWTFHEGAKAPQAAGVIHTDFERGFIKAEVYHCDHLFEFRSEQKVKEAGKFRIEGKEYVVKDGDVMHFRFNV